MNLLSAYAILQLDIGMGGPGRMERGVPQTPSASRKQSPGILGVAQRIDGHHCGIDPEGLPVREWHYASL